MNRYEKLNKVRFLIDDFKESMEGIPYTDIKEYQEEFKEYIWKEYNVVIDFGEGNVIIDY